MRQRVRWARGGARRDRGYQRYRGHGRGRPRFRVTGRADGARGTIGTPGHMGMLRALLLAAEEQGRAQGAAHLRHDAGNQPAGHQPGAFPYHDLAGRRAAAQMCAIGGCLLMILSSSVSVMHQMKRKECFRGYGSGFGD